jgi:hypothetical protein
MSCCAGQGQGRPSCWAGFSPPATCF